ncbi:MAG TPA: hypothetical protein VEJ89_14065 [Myxococcaceae bacterium]|jgi:hypothetical protein|nr:hypothetical protein [Myxococcaceae bacterium]
MQRREWSLVALAVLAGAGCRSTGSSSDGGPPELTVNMPIPGTGTTHPECSWTQLGQNAAHTGTACAPAQGFSRVLAMVTFDPFVDLEVADGDGDLYVHYQAPLVAADDVYVETKSGQYTACDAQGNGPDGGPCGPAAWDTQVWGEVHHRWQGGALVEVNRFDSDWVPVPPDLAGGWEPLFHAALDGNVLWVPGAGGTVFRVDAQSLVSLGRINPFGPALDPDSYLSGPITVAPDGTVLYNVVRLAGAADGGTDARGVLVRIDPGLAVQALDYASLMTGAPAPTDLCLGSYRDEVPRPARPYPPSDDHRVSVACGPLRPGINVAPAVGPDGTVFTVARPDHAENAGMLLALHPDLTPKWSATLQEILGDGCGVRIPADAQASGRLPDGGTDLRHCRVGAPTGVDPLTGQRPSGMVDDESTSSPVVLPDGSVLYGALNVYNNSRGHLLKFDASGQLLATYDDGWDQTPAVWSHDGTYSIIVKDNHYFSWFDAGEGPYQITQVGADLSRQWSFTSTNTYSCARGADGGVGCTSDHPDGFEWCINAPAVDERGTVYVNSEDGRTYALVQGGAEAQSRFLVLSLGAAYTPVTVDGQGRVYTMNGGVMTVVGN